MLHAVRAKFTVSRIELTPGSRYVGKDGDGRSLYESCTMYTIYLHPVTGGDSENEKFFASTPSGEIKLGTVNEEAAKSFYLGKPYYVEFTPAFEGVPA